MYNFVQHNAVLPTARPGRDMLINSSTLTVLASRTHHVVDNRDNIVCNRTTPMLFIYFFLVFFQPLVGAASSLEEPLLHRQLHPSHCRLTAHGSELFRPQCWETWPPWWFRYINISATKLTVQVYPNTSGDRRHRPVLVPRSTQQRLLAMWLGLLVGLQQSCAVHVREHLPLLCMLTWHWGDSSFHLSPKPAPSTSLANRKCWPWIGNPHLPAWCASFMMKKREQIWLPARIW
jgi:hypothetical protein